MSLDKMILLVIVIFIPLFLLFGLMMKMEEINNDLQNNKNEIYNILDNQIKRISNSESNIKELCEDWIALCTYIVK